MEIGIDLDGVCYDFGDACERYAESIGLPHRLPVPRIFSFYQGWGMDGPAFRAFTDAGVDAGVIFSGPTMPGAPEALQRLAAAGHRLHIKTHRDQGTGFAAQEATEKWLWQHSMPYHTLTFTADKTSGPPCEVFVEDQIGNYDALDAFGVVPYLVNRDWNVVPEGDRRRRIADITEFADLWTTGARR